MLKLESFLLVEGMFLFLFNFFFGVGQHLYKSRKAEPFDTSHEGCTLVQNCMMKAAAFCLWSVYCALSLASPRGEGEWRRSAARLRLIGAQSERCPAFCAGCPVCMLMLLHV